jgi:hypothetical protein
MSMKHPEFYDIYGKSLANVSDIINCNIMSVREKRESIYIDLLSINFIFAKIIYLLSFVKVTKMTSICLPGEEYL